MTRVHDGDFDAEALAYIESLQVHPAAAFARANRSKPLAVLDTNAVLDVYFWKDPGAQRLSEAIAAGTIDCVTTRSCFKEFAAVLERPHLAPERDRRFELIHAYGERVLMCEAPEEISAAVCRDEDDQKFLNLAQAVEADWLITKDKLVLRAAKRLKTFGIATVKPAEFGNGLS